MAQVNIGGEINLLNPNSMTSDERLAQIAEEEKREADRKKREKNSPFSRWTQFNNEHTKEIMWLTLKHPKAQAILLFLVDQMDNYNAVICSHKVLQEVLDVSDATIKRNVKILKDNGFIAVLKSGTSNVYAINDTVFWKAWGNKKEYSKFPASVILSLSEQEECLQTKLKTLKLKEVVLDDTPTKAKKDTPTE